MNVLLHQITVKDSGALKKMQLSRIPYLRALPVLESRPKGLQPALNDTVQNLNKKFRKVSKALVICT